ncbi:MAG: hypothetical protein R3C01_12690 [Planctomycetaceae bacterium]
MSREQNAVRYLIPSQPTFWAWGEDGNVVEYVDEFGRSGTLAFRQQLLAALTPFANRSLPSLELVFLVLAACRDNWPDVSRRLREDRVALGDNPRPMMQQWWLSSLVALDRVHELPQQIRTNAAAVATIVEIALERHPRTFDVADDVLAILAQSRWMQDRVLPEATVAREVERIQDLTSLPGALARLSVDRVLTRMGTSLDQLPEVPAEREEVVEELPPLEQRTVRQLLEELKDDEEHGELVRLVRMVSAVLTLPRELTIPEELPQGGVSDITNRGVLDRLLLSELANDDDTLMTRIALNEALYIRRESPPADPPRERALLIDAGIRMWGLPRLCATAVGLSLASKLTGAVAVRVYRSSDAGPQPVDLTTRAGLTEHLSALDTLTHPGENLAAWLEALNDRSNGASASPLVDRILITGEDVASDLAFRRQLQESGVVPCYLITVNRAGHVRLLQQTPLGEKQLRELWLDLDSLSHAKQNKSNSLVDNSKDRDFPAIMRLQQLPLRLPYHLQNDFKSLVEFPRTDDRQADLLCVTRDHRLLLFDSEKRGGRQVTDQLPPGKLRWSGQLTNDGTFSLVLVRHDGVAHLVRVERDGYSFNIDIVPLNVQGLRDTGEHLYAVTGYLGVLLFIGKQTILAINPIDGEPLGATEVGHNRFWKRDRYFGGSRWVAVSFVNGSFHFDVLIDPVSHPKVLTSDVTILGVINVRGIPFAVLSSGEIYDIIRRKTHPVVPRNYWKYAAVHAVSPNGVRFVISNSTNQNGTARDRYELVTVSKKEELKAESKSFFYDPILQLRFGDRQLPQELTLHKSPAKLAYGRHFGDKHSLSIVTKKGAKLMFSLRQGSPQEVYLRTVTDEAGTLKETERFQDIPSPAGVGCSLQEVTWSDGSRAVLDSRGMLHLRSSDPQIPELSLVLFENSVAAWSSSGLIWGRAYFVDEHAPFLHTPDNELLMQLIRQFVERLP